MFTLTQTLWGVGVDLKELGRRIRSRLKKARVQEQRDSERSHIQEIGHVARRFTLTDQFSRVLNLLESLEKLQKLFQ